VFLQARAVRRNSLASKRSGVRDQRNASRSLPLYSSLAGGLIPRSEPALRAVLEFSRMGPPTGPRPRSVYLSSRQKNSQRKRSVLVWRNTPFV